MQDKIFKVKIFFRFYGLKLFKEWIDQVWKYELDEQMCCGGGSMCGCQGATHRALWEWKLSLIQEGK